MAVAVGPFTTSEDLEFAPLAELLSSCRVSRPDLLLLMGPFVDVEHALIANGSLDITFEELYDKQVRPSPAPACCVRGLTQWCLNNRLPSANSAKHGRQGLAQHVLTPQQRSIRISPCGTERLADQE